MAERSKAPVSGTGLFGGVGSNPTPIILVLFGPKNLVRLKKKMDRPIGWHDDVVGWPSGLRRYFPGSSFANVAQIWVDFMTHGEQFCNILGF